MRRMSFAFKILRCHFQIVVGLQIHPEFTRVRPRRPRQTFGWGAFT
jgi:hypothetical protein